MLKFRIFIFASLYLAGLFVWPMLYANQNITWNAPSQVREVKPCADALKEDLDSQKSLRIKTLMDYALPPFSPKKEVAFFENFEKSNVKFLLGLSRVPLEIQASVRAELLKSLETGEFNPTWSITGETIAKRLTMTQKVYELLDLLSEKYPTKSLNNDLNKELKARDYEDIIERLHTPETIEFVMPISLELAKRLQKTLPKSSSIRSWISRSLHEHRLLCDEIVRRNLRLSAKIVYSQSRFWKPLGLSFDDALAYANQGIVKSLYRFDLRRGFKFSTSTVTMMKQALTIELERLQAQAKAFNPSALSREIRAAEKFLESWNSRPTNDEEIAAYLNLPLAKVMAARNEPKGPITGQTALATEDKVPIERNMNAVKDDNEVSALPFLSEIMTELMPFFDRLSFQQQTVLIHRLGLFDTEVKTLEATGKILGVTKERVRQIEKKAKLRLKELMRIHDMRLEDFVPNAQDRLPDELSADADDLD